MNKNNKSTVLIFRMGQLWYGLPLSILLLSGNAWGVCATGNHNIIISECNASNEQVENCSYAMVRNQVIQNESIGVTGGFDPFDIQWSVSDLSVCTEDPSDPPPPVFNCLGVDFNYSDSTVTINGQAHDADDIDASFRLKVTEIGTGNNCSRVYEPRITGSGGGWGDPHITTVEGVKYDFQSAGEFVLLRGKDLQIQTRQTAISKQSVLGENPYTGIASCVSVYTAVAAKVGSHRVTIQPNLSGVPDPSGLQLRVDGELRHLGPDGIELASCNCDSDTDSRSGRIVRSEDDQGFEIRYADGTKLVVTPGWWESQKKWYLHVNVYDTTATEGVMGLIAKDSWLPALEDGSNVGARGKDSSERYAQLYKKFADSWRVGHDNKSLFDYANGTSTDTFTMAEWPRENPSNCRIADEPVVEPVPESVAKEVCRDVADEHNQENCVIDVAATGHIGFADAYVRAEQVTPGATKIALSADKAASKRGEEINFTAVVKRKVSTIAKVSTGSVQFVLDGNPNGDPVALDSNGMAIWNSSNLSSGDHDIEARFLPSGFGERFRSSRSLKVSHNVSTFSANVELSLYAGFATPMGNFNQNYDQGSSVMLEAEYKRTSDYSLTAMLGNNKFKGETPATADTYWNNLSVNYKYYVNTASGKIWLNAGVGAYQPEDGSTRAGSNYGFGYEFYKATEFRGVVIINQHTVYGTASDIQFVTTHFGAVYNF